MDPTNDDLLRDLAKAFDELQVARKDEQIARDRRDRECGRGPDEGWGEHDAPEPWQSWRRYAAILKVVHTSYQLAIQNCIDRGKAI